MPVPPHTLYAIEECLCDRRRTDAEDYERICGDFRWIGQVFFESRHGQEMVRVLKGGEHLTFTIAPDTAVSPAPNRRSFMTVCV